MMTSITIFRNFFIENIFIYVSFHTQKYRIKPILIKEQAHIFIQILAISGTLINYLNRHCEREIMRLRYRERNSLDKLFSTKRFGISIRSILILYLRSFHSPFPSIFLFSDLPINASWLSEAGGGILLIY
jgi:hypothetical protein